MIIDLDRVDEQIETYTSILTSKGKPYDIESQNPIAKWNFNEDGDIYYTTYLGGEEHLYKESCLDSYFEKAIKDLQLEKQLYKENFGTMHVTVRRNLDSFEDTLTYERC